MNFKTEVIDMPRSSLISGPYKAVFMTVFLGALLVVSMLFGFDANAQQAERPDFGGGGIFSYVPPNGWKVMPFPGLKFKVSRGEPFKGFAPNIVVADDDFDKTLDEYAQGSIATLKELFPGMQLISQTDFKTSDGTRVIKLLTERDDDAAKKRLRQVFYLYDAGNKKLVATCSSLAETAPASDLVCDAAMKTFDVTPKPH